MKDVSLLIRNGINVEGSLELFGDIEMYNETLNDFLNCIDKKMADIKRYKESSDMPNYAILVHSLKSDSKYLGFTKLADFAYEHELKSKENDITYVYKHYDELIQEAVRIINIVKEYMGLPTNNVMVKEPVLKDKTILVVDDSNIIVNFIKKIFNNEYEIIVASDGREAIDAVELNPNNNIVAMLLDLNMPNVNGFEVLEYFDKNSLFSRVSVSIVTGEDYRDTVEKVFAYPVVDILTKPFNERDIKQVVEKTIRGKN